MPTSEDLAGQLASAVIAQTSATAQMTHDYRDDLERLAPGATLCQVQVDVFGFDHQSANDSREVARATVRLLHRLADPRNERAYRSAKLADQRVLCARAFWQGLSAVYDVLQGPEVTEATERLGHVLSYGVSASVRLKV